MCEDRRLLRGSIDMHVHGSPSLFPRLLDHAQCAMRAKEEGMKGIVIKCHHGFTADRVYWVKMMVEGIDVFGGVVLNSTVGGLNPFAVEAAIAYGAKVIWMPTLSAKNHLDQLGEPEGPNLKRFRGLELREEGISILDEKDNLLPQVKDICALIAEHDIILATGHLSVQEIFPLVKEAREVGVKKVLINHPEYIVNGSVSEQKELAQMGAYIEHTLISMMPMWYRKDPKEIVRMVKEVGPEHTILSTDFGQTHHPPPHEGMRMLIRMMLELGISSQEVELMVKRNPRRLLGIL
jgi:hypothetical protein